MREIIDKLASERRLTKEEWVTIIENRTPELAEYLFEKARQEQGVTSLLLTLIHLNLRVTTSMSF